MHLVGLSTLCGWKFHEPNEVNQTGLGLAVTHSRVFPERGHELSKREPNRLGRGGERPGALLARRAENGRMAC
jgi:hypothetical protein